MDEQSLKKKLNFMIVTIVLLVCGLTVTSLALASSIAQVKENRFTMSMGVELNINNGDPVVDVTDVQYEPGETYKSEFPISNLGTFDVWYRVYFTDVKGELKDYITVTVKEQDGTVLCSGIMSQLSYDKSVISSLKAGEEKTLYIEFYFAPADNVLQEKMVYFNITAAATQKQNNPGKDFGN